MGTLISHNEFARLDWTNEFDLTLKQLYNLTSEFCDLNLMWCSWWHFCVGKPDWTHAEIYIHRIWICLFVWITDNKENNLLQQYLDMNHRNNIILMNCSTLFIYLFINFNIRCWAWSTDENKKPYKINCTLSTGPRRSWLMSTRAYYIDQFRF